MSPPGQPDRPARPEKVCDPDHILCPRCGDVLRRVTVGPGSTVATCDARTDAPAPGQRYPKPCGQHLFIYGTPDGIAVVFAITREEHEYLTARGMIPPPADALRTLKVLRQRDASRVPERRCDECRRARKLFDLYKGTCRWCRDGTRAPEEESAAA